MIRTFLRLFFSLSVVALAVFPHTSGAAGLVPCGLSGNLADQCEFCDVIALIQNIIHFLAFVVAAPLVTVFIAWAGIQLIINGSDPGARTKAKEILKDALVGFLFILFAWTIVNIVLNALVNNNGGSEESRWYSIQCVNKGAQNVDIRTLSPGGSLQSTNTGTTANTAGTVTNAQAVQTFASACTGGVCSISVVSTGNCSNQNVSTCTSFDGMKQSTVNGIVNLAKDCSATNAGCSVSVSGGTEVGHSSSGDNSHIGGAKFDAQINNTAFNSYMTNLIKTQNNVSSVQDNVVYQVKVNGTTYQTQYENVAGGKPHWDTTVR